MESLQITKVSMELGHDIEEGQQGLMRASGQIFIKLLTIIDKMPIGGR